GHRRTDEHERAGDEREVQREDPAPRELVDDEAPGERADDRRDPAPGGPRADRRASLLRRERSDDDRERGGRDQGRRGALYGTSRDQDADRRSERADEGKDTEGRDPDAEDAPLTVDVAERAPDQDERAERKQVGVRDPLLGGEPAAQI